jgi:pimeloyl-ACP methyl ester carboxylesterase
MSMSDRLPEPELLARRDLVIDGVRVALFEAGAGPPIVLLHGYPQSHRCWRRVAPALATSHRVIVPDWFGWGESERSLALAPRFDDEVHRVGALLDALGLDRVAIAGHDYGGLLALAFATRSPARVTRLALINTRAHGTFSWPWYLTLGAATWLARIPLLGRSLALWPSYTLHRRIIMRRYVANGSFDEAELDGYLRWMATWPGRRWFAHFYRHFRISPRRELGRAAPTLAMPIALIWGDRDPYFPFAIAEDLATRIPKAMLTRIEGGDHYVVEERPTEVIAALRGWLAVEG